jgi:hypothetical protein
MIIKSLRISVSFGSVEPDEYGSSYKAHSLCQSSKEVEAVQQKDDELTLK